MSVTAVRAQSDARASSALQKQFRFPRGVIGRLVGWVMLGENRRMNELAVRCLAVEPGEDVLEIGSGPGHALELLAKQTAAQRIVGIDPSAEMLDQAQARNQAAISEGLIGLALGDVAALPFAENCFSRVVAVSNFHLWPSREEGLREVARVLRPGGRLVLAARRAKKSPWPWSSPGITARQIDSDRALLVQCGFENVELIDAPRGRSLCLIARRA